MTVLSVSPFLLGACSSTEPPTSSATTSATAAEQSAQGAKVYADRCARCHGEAGQGSKKAPALVGAGSLPLHPREGQVRTRPFHTALDIALFATQAMPPDEDVRAEMTTDEYWAVLSFALTANGVALKEPVNADNAAAIVLHP